MSAEINRQITYQLIATFTLLVSYLLLKVLYSTAKYVVHIYISVCDRVFKDCLSKDSILGARNKIENLLARLKITAKRSLQENAYPLRDDMKRERMCDETACVTLDFVSLLK